MTRAMQEMRVLDTKILSIEFIIFSLLLALMYTIITRQVIDPVRRLQEMLGYFREHREKSPAEEAPTSGDEFEVLAHDITEVQDIILQDSEQLQKYLDLIQRMALRDELTGVQNHTAYENKLSELTAVITAGTAEFAILMADMNGLKFVNDVYGHEKGDIALRAMSRALCDIFKHSPDYPMKNAPCEALETASQGAFCMALSRDHVTAGSRGFRRDRSGNRQDHRRRCCSKSRNAASARDGTCRRSCRRNP